MNDEKTALEEFRKIVIKAQKKGQKGLLIWKNPEEREKWGGNEEQIWVTKAFEVHGYAPRWNSLWSLQKYESNKGNS